MTSRKDAKFYLRLCISTLVIFAILGYAYLKTRDLMRGVRIIVYEPLSNTLFTDSFVEVRGNITKSSAVFLNDRKIFLDESGNFKEQLLLLPGYNIITLRAEDRFKRQAEKKLTLVYKKPLKEMTATSSTPLSL